jgi:phage terminase large subunit-like protein
VKGNATRAESEKYRQQKIFESKKFPLFSIKLSMKQRMILEAFEQDDLGMAVDEVEGIGGNRSAKTVLGIYFALLMASGYWPAGYTEERTEDGETVFQPILQQNPQNITVYTPSQVWISCMDRNLQIAPHGPQDILMSMLPPSWIRPNGIKKFNRVYIHSIDLKNKTVIQFKSAESGPDKYQTASLDAAVLDEVHPEAVYREIVSRQGARPLRVLYMFYPRNGIDWTYKEFVTGYREELRKIKQSGETPIRKVFFISMLDNPFLPKRAKESMLKRWANDPMKNSRIYGTYTELSGLVYPKLNRDWHLVDTYANASEQPNATWLEKAEDFKAIRENKGQIPDEWPIVIAIDTHNSEKGCAAVFCAVSPQGRSWYYREYESRGTPPEWGRDIKTLIEGDNVTRIWKDSSANATDAYGYSIARALEDEIGMALDDADKRRREVGIFAVSERLGVLENEQKEPVDGGPGIVFTTMAPKTFSQMETYSRKNGAVGVGDVIKRDDEYVDCVQYIEKAEPALYYQEQWELDNMALEEAESHRRYNAFTAAL